MDMINCVSLSLSFFYIFFKYNLTCLFSGKQNSIIDCNHSFDSILILHQNPIHFMANKTIKTDPMIFKPISKLYYCLLVKERTRWTALLTFHYFVCLSMFYLSVLFLTKRLFYSYVPMKTNFGIFIKRTINS